MTVFKGVFTALVTPFRNGAIDEDCYRALIERQVSAGVAGIVPVGTTGESPTISLAEHARLIELATTTAAGRILVVAGCGSNDTTTAIDHMRHAKTVGADAALVVAPYYNKPNAAGIIAHFDALCAAVQLPVIVYNIPGRTGVDITPATLATTAAHPNVAGVKDSAGDPSRTVLHRAACPDGFALLAGDDNLAVGFGAYGADGVVSVLSNIVPERCVAMQAAMAKGDFTAARTINAELDGLQRALFAEPNPAPTKHVLGRLGLCDPQVRLPLVGVSADTAALLDGAIDRLGLL